MVAVTRVAIGDGQHRRVRAEGGVVVVGLKGMDGHAGTGSGTASAARISAAIAVARCGAEPT